MALTTENENYAQAYNGHLENKTTIQSTVFGDILSNRIYGKQLLCLGG